MKWAWKIQRVLRRIPIGYQSLEGLEESHPTDGIFTNDWEAALDPRPSGAPVWCSICDVESVACGECGMRRVWHAESVTCGECGMWRVYHAKSVACGECGMWRVWHVENAAYEEMEYRCRVRLAE